MTCEDCPLKDQCHNPDFIPVGAAHLNQEEEGIIAEYNNANRKRQLDYDDQFMKVMKIGDPDKLSAIVDCAQKTDVYYESRKKEIAAKAIANEEESQCSGPIKRRRYYLFGAYVVTCGSQTRKERLGITA